MADAADIEAARTALLGRSTRSEVRTIGEDDLGLVSSLTWGVSELHTNKELMREHEHGDRLFPGPVLAAVVTGLHRGSAEQRTALLEAGLRLGPMVSFAARYAGPVLVGDKIEALTTVVAVDLSDQTIALRDSAVNQRGEVVLSMDRVHRIEEILPQA